MCAKVYLSTLQNSDTAVLECGGCVGAAVMTGAKQCVACPQYCSSCAYSNKQPVCDDTKCNLPPAHSGYGIIRFKIQD